MGITIGRKIVLTPLSPEEYNRTKELGELRDLARRTCEARKDAGSSLATQSLVRALFADRFRKEADQFLKERFGNDYAPRQGLSERSRKLLASLRAKP